MNTIEEMTLTIAKLNHHDNSMENCIEFSCSTVTFNANSTWEGWDDLMFSTVGFKLILKRNFGKHFFSYYIPSLLIVVLSWVSFAIPPEVIPGRMGLLITLILVLVNLFGTFIEKRPPTGNAPTVLDIWIFVSIIFVCSALLAYAILMLHKRFRVGKCSESSVKTVAPAIGQVSSREEHENREYKENDYNPWDRNFLMTFPLAFLLFNFIYWTIVLTNRFS